MCRCAFPCQELRPVQPSFYKVWQFNHQTIGSYTRENIQEFLKLSPEVVRRQLNFEVWYYDDIAREVNCFIIVTYNTKLMIILLGASLSKGWAGWNRSGEKHMCSKDLKACLPILHQLVLYIIGQINRTCDWWFSNSRFITRHTRT